MAANLNSVMLDWDTAILDSDTLLSSLRFTQKHSHSTLTLTQTNSIGLKLIYSHLNWWWSHLEFHPLEFGHLWFSYLSIFFQTQSHLPTLVPNICTKKTSLIQYDSTWWWQPSWILPCWMGDCILDSDTLLSSLRFTQKHSHSTLTLTQTNSIWLKLIHSHLTWRWQPSWILTSWIWPSWIQPS